LNALWLFGLNYFRLQSEDQISIPEKIISVSNSVQETSKEKIREQLIALINELINKDFFSLLQLLYRIDVDEKKIRSYLKQNTNEDSASVLADLIIERQLQKVESRKHFRKENNQESDEEKW
jgi:aspartate oxidase